MKKILGATLALALASTVFAAPQTPTKDQSGTAGTKTAKKGKHTKGKKPKTVTTSPRVN